jgi:hypothetical protein
MTRHLRILLAGFLAAAVSVSTPALAVGNSLLSGYGGPGQGSQAILGSTLIGGGAGGGSNGGGGGEGAGVGGAGGGSSSGSLHLGERVAAAGSSTGSGSGGQARQGNGSGGGRSGAGGGSGSRPGAGRASARGASTYPTVAVQAADVGGSQVLGLSGDGLLYVLLAIVVLVLTGVLTRRLARTEGPESNIR